MKIFVKILFYSFLTLSITSCQVLDKPATKESELIEIEKVINNCIGWAINKDFELLYKAIVNDSNYLSVHPTDRVVIGFEQFKSLSAFWQNPNFQAVSHDIQDLKITLSQNMDVAWFYCILNDYNTWKGEPANWENTRWTGVLEKRNGLWVIVQQHFSFASNN